MKRYPTQDQLAIRDKVEYLSDCSFSAQLYDRVIRPYPFVLLGGGVVRGELYRILDPQAWIQLDRCEAYDSKDPENSLYLPKQIDLIEPKKSSRMEKAWIYEWNRPLEESKLISTGFWDSPLYPDSPFEEDEELARKKSNEKA